MNTNLYELSLNYKELAEIEAEELQDTFDSIQEALEVKVENTVKLIKELEAQAEATQKEAQRLLSLSKARTNRSEQLKKLLFDVLTITQKKRLQTSIGVVSKAKNPPSVKILNEKLIPAQYWKSTPASRQPDLTLLKEKLNTGHKIPGVELRQELRLSIR